MMESLAGKPAIVSAVDPISSSAATPDPVTAPTTATAQQVPATAPVPSGKECTGDVETGTAKPAEPAAAGKQPNSQKKCSCCDGCGVPAFISESECCDFLREWLPDFCKDKAAKDAPLSCCQVIMQFFFTLVFFGAFALEAALLLVAVGIRMLLVKPAGGAVRWLLQPFLSNNSQRSLQKLLQPRLKKQWSKLLSTIIIVSGLLTTSTYPAVYAEYMKPGPTNSTATNATRATNSTSRVLESPRLVAEGMLPFRAVNLFSFAGSLASIVCCTVVLLFLNNYAPESEEKSATELQPWAASLVYVTYVLAIFTFYFSLGCVALAAVMGSLGFLKDSWARFLGFITVVTCVGLTLLASATSGIVYTKDRGLVPPVPPIKPLTVSGNKTQTKCGCVADTGCAVLLPQSASICLAI